jgi:hypothetical protein
VTRMANFSAEIRDVTPKMAREILARNTENRNLRPAYVRQLAAAMERGEWVLNGEPVQIAEDGMLLNGQHRLSAVVESGVTVQMVIIEGLAVSARRTMDMGTRRNLSDVLALHGKIDTTNLAAVLGLLHRYRTGARVDFASRTAPTVPQALQLLEQEPGIEEAVTDARRIYRVCRLRMTVAAFLLYIFEEEDPGMGKRFFDAVCEPRREPEGSAAVVLRSHLDRVRAEPNYQFSSVVLLAVTIKAFNAWREGRSVEVLSYRPGGESPEQFPKIAPKTVIGSELT